MPLLKSIFQKTEIKIYCGSDNTYTNCHTTHPCFRSPNPLSARPGSKRQLPTTAVTESAYLSIQRCVSMAPESDQAHSSTHYMLCSWLQTWTEYTIAVCKLSTQLYFLHGRRARYLNQTCLHLPVFRPYRMPLVPQLGLPAALFPLGPTSYREFWSA